MARGTTTAGEQREFPMAHEDPHRQMWLKFHAANPHVFDALRHLAFELADVGVVRWSIRDLFAVLRHDEALKTKGTVWKLDNTLCAIYARELMAAEPRLVGFFETRETKA